MKLFVKEVEEKSFLEEKLEGLKSRRPDKVAYILEIEEIWKRYALDRTNQINEEKLFKVLTFTIKQKSKAMESRWKNKGLSKQDFLSIYYETTLKLADQYHQYITFYFYETFLLALENRGIDLTRKLLTRQGQFESTLLPLKEETAEFIQDERVNVEMTVINRDTVQQILNEPSLTVQERKVLETIYRHPDASYTDIARKAGLNHHEQVRRSLKSIRKKVTHIFL